MRVDNAYYMVEHAYIWLQPLKKYSKFIIQITNLLKKMLHVLTQQA